MQLISTAVGAISESDILLAIASNAIVVGFNVRPERNAAALAENEKRSTSACIWSSTSLTDEIKKALARLARAGHQRDLRRLRADVARGVQRGRNWGRSPKLHARCRMRAGVPANCGRRETRQRGLRWMSAITPRVVATHLDGDRLATLLWGSGSLRRYSTQRSVIKGQRGVSRTPLRLVRARCTTPAGSRRNAALRLHISTVGTRRNDVTALCCWRRCRSAM